MPAAFSTATARMASPDSSRAAVVVRPSWKAGTMTRSVTRPSTHAEATVMVP